jgi:hypothetical protein
MILTIKRNGDLSHGQAKTLRVKKPYISSPFGWGLDGGSQRIYRAERPK